MIPISLINDRVMIKMIQPSNKTEGGIILGEPSPNEIVLAEVVAVGPGRHIEGTFNIGAEVSLSRQPMVVRVGDNVLVQPRGGEISFMGEEFRILREDHIHGILREEV